MEIGISEGLKYNAMVEKEVFEIGRLPPGQKAIPNLWVFKNKGEGVLLERCKTRIVCMGNRLQDYGTNHYSPVARAASKRIVIAFRPEDHLCLIDVGNTFINAPLKKPFI